jgi:uncharacterized protein (DUF2384 family)
MGQKQSVSVSLGHAPEETGRVWRLTRVIAISVIFQNEPVRKHFPSCVSGNEQR